MADTWAKLFFMKDYTYPLYRALNERYENGIDRQEFCTLWMISTPDTPDSQKCFAQLGVDFAMVGARPTLRNSAAVQPSGKYIPAMK